MHIHIHIYTYLYTHMSSILIQISIKPWSLPHVAQKKYFEYGIKKFITVTTMLDWPTVNACAYVHAIHDTFVNINITLSVSTIRLTNSKCGGNRCYSSCCGRCARCWGQLGVFVHRQKSRCLWLAVACCAVSWGAKITPEVWFWRKFTIINIAWPNGTHVSSSSKDSR